MVYPLGKYGDFAKVDVVLDEMTLTGFIHSTAVEELPDGLLELQASDVPMANIDLSTNFLDPKSSLADGAIVINNDYDWFYDLVGAPFQSTAGLSVSFLIATNNGQYGSIKFTDRYNDVAGARRMDVFSCGEKLCVDIRDGLSETSETGFELNIANTQTILIRFEDAIGRYIVFSSISGQVIKRIDTTLLPDVSLPDGLFSDNQVYIGAVTSPNTVLTIKDLAATKIPSGIWVESWERLPLLSLADESGISIGTVAGLEDLRYPDIVNILSSEFNLMVVNDFSWKGIWLAPGQYDFSFIDTLVDWARLHGFRVRASHLIWGAPETLPDWLVQSKYSREEYLDLMNEYIRDVMTHYEGRVDEWSIANEMIARGCTPSLDFWCGHIGASYVDAAFRTAHTVNPNAVLIFNDVNNECARNAATRYITISMYNFVKALISTGTPIDGIGMQMHLSCLSDSNPATPSKQCVLETMVRYAEMGLGIYITEMDVNLHSVQGTQSERFAFQAGVYHDMIAACIESGACKSFTTWGISDATSWLNCPWNWCQHIENADPLMFDYNFHPKPAYQAIFDALSGM
jgi:endo-1,4-beta-xylanase